MSEGPLDLVRHVASILDELGIDWVLGGSLASSIFGVPRATVDADVAVRIPGEAAEALLGRVMNRFYVPEATARSAIEQHDTFNILDTEHGLKLDVFVLGDDVLDRHQLERRQRVELAGTDDVLWVTAPEDQVLRKLDWFRLGDRQSERQWRDVLGLLAMQEGSIDLAYMREVAHEVGLDDLLDRALSEANLPDPTEK